MFDLDLSDRFYEMDKFFAQLTGDDQRIKTQGQVPEEKQDVALQTDRS